MAPHLNTEAQLGRARVSSCDRYTSILVSKVTLLFALVTPFVSTKWRLPHQATKYRPMHSHLLFQPRAQETATSMPGSAPLPSTSWHTLWPTLTYPRSDRAPTGKGFQKRWREFKRQCRGIMSVPVPFSRARTGLCATEICHQRNTPYRLTHSKHWVLVRVHARISGPKLERSRDGSHLLRFGMICMFDP